MMVPIGCFGVRHRSNRIPPSQHATASVSQNSVESRN
jgi:hypothetical protein